VTTPMTTIRHRRSPLPVLALLAVLSGCATSTEGSPLPTTSTASSTTGNPVGDVDAAAKLAAMDPCSLLSQAQIDQYGLRKKDEGNLVGARQCTWSHPSDEHAKGGYAIGPAIWDHQGLRDINTKGYTVADQSIGRHQARQAQQTLGDACFVAIGVTESARVDVVVSGEPGTACPLANQFATLIEPLLPGDS
jgi:hypothetical protein